MRSAGHNDGETYCIGKGLILRGEISGVGDVQVEGEFEGKINLTGTVVIHEGAKVRADIFATDITVAGEVHGDVMASGKVELSPTCNLVGSIQSRRLVVREGAAVKGSIRAETPPSPGAEFAEIAQLVQDKETRENNPG